MMTTSHIVFSIGLFAQKFITWYLMLNLLVPQWIFGLGLLFIRRSLTFFSLSHSVLSPIINMPISDSKRQRVLVTACVLYSEVSLP